MEIINGFRPKKDALICKFSTGTIQSRLEFTFSARYIDGMRRKKNRLGEFKSSAWQNISN